MCFLYLAHQSLGGLGACGLTERQFILVLKASHSPDSVLFEQMGCLLRAFTPLFCLQLLLTKSYTSVFLYFFAQPSGLSCFFRVIGPMTACRLMTSTSIFTTWFFFSSLWNDFSTPMTVAMHGCGANKVEDLFGVSCPGNVAIINPSNQTRHSVVQTF